MREYKIALAGNANVGKSTIFNSLTGLNQHTGNWSGKTVDIAIGKAEFKGNSISIVDLPGTYSLFAEGDEEEIASSYLVKGDYDAVIVVCDATVLERNLILAIQVLNITKRALICVNMIDEAKRKGIELDAQALEQSLGVPIVLCSARQGKGLDKLLDTALNIAKSHEFSVTAPAIQALTDNCKVAHRIAEKCIKSPGDRSFDRKLDKIITGRYTAVPIMLVLLALILFITIYAANLPSQLLSQLFDFLLAKLDRLFVIMSLPRLINSLLIDGVLKTLAWVVSVMLPPMVIFFPLFTILEDAGLLPRIAYNLDKHFKCACACGKQALTMCMGFGCNAVGVTGCRIIESKRERTIAQLTNSFVPCNGRFPTLISIISMFFVATGAALTDYVLSAGILTLVIILGIAMTFFASRLLSKTVLKGEPSSFMLELPPYRRPQIKKVIVNSLINRAAFVLFRAVVVAAPAGLVIWLLANLSINNISLLMNISGFLDPFARLLGLDGMIFLAFILGLPANEIVVPIIIMGYTSAGSLMDISSLTALRSLLIDNGWTIKTAICVMLFSLMHWPCSTTCLTIYKETKSVKYTALGVLVPTVCGMMCCFLVEMVGRVLG